FYAENLTLVAGADGIYGEGNYYDNIITGNESNNIIRDTGGSNTIDGGDGIDTRDYSNVGEVVVDLEAGEASQNGGGGSDDLTSIENVTGSNGGDSISNHLLGLAGSDSISAGDGNNTVEGGTQEDTLSAGSGDDILNGGTEN